MTAERIDRAFERIRRRGQTGVIPFLTAGFPTVDVTRQLVPALEEAGADLVELGVPFSDPLADGPTIQKASFHALRQGVTLGGCIALCRELREQGVRVPLVLMGYYNPLLSFGIARFASEATDAGIDGVIVADLPPEEAQPLKEACAQQGMDLIVLLAPTSTDQRIARACTTASGFIYCVSLAGVTGARDQLPPGMFQLVRRIRAHTDLPLAVGFGVSRREHVEAIGQHAQAAIVGSALLDVIDSSPQNLVVDRVRRFLAQLTGRDRTAG